MRARQIPVLRVLICVLALLFATSCGDPGRNDDPPASGNIAHAQAVSIEPDPLPDPGVRPGDCKVLTYTPTGAPEPQQGELCRPEKGQRDVAVVIVHGGSGIGGSREGMRPWARRLLAEGYVVFMPEYHLFTPGSRESPVFPLPEQDVKAAVQYLRGTAGAMGIARDRIVVQGMSAGARLGAVAYTSPDNSAFDGPTRWPGISDRVDGFVGYYHPYDGSMQYSTQYYGGVDDSKDPAVRARWDEADALANASRARGPALFVTGSRDWDLQIHQQDEFASRLDGSGLSATTLVVTGGGHGFDQAGTSLTRLGEQALTTELAWLNDKFPQDPRRDPQVATSDVASAPNDTGAPPTTYAPRTRSASTPTTLGAATPTATSPLASPSTTSSVIASTTTTARPPPTTTTTGAPSTTTTSVTVVTPP